MKNLLIFIFFCLTLFFSCSKDTLTREKLDDIQFKLVLDTLSKNKDCIEGLRDVLSNQNSLIWEKIEKYNLTLERKKEMYERQKIELDSPLTFRVATIDFPIDKSFIKNLSKDEIRDYFDIRVKEERLEQAIKDTLLALGEMAKKSIALPQIYPNRRKYSIKNALQTLVITRINERILGIKVLITCNSRNVFCHDYDEYGVEMASYLRYGVHNFYIFFDKDLKKINKIIHEYRESTF